MTNGTDQLRDGVERAIVLLGEAQLASRTLRQRLRSGRLEAQEYFRQLIRQVYHLLFQRAAESRGLVFNPTEAALSELQTLRHVDFRRAGARELGGVYEALLELHPVIDLEARSFRLATAPGHERKTSGSYYTPACLIDCLLDTALDPVLDEAARQHDPAAALLRLKVCDPACGSGLFLLAAARRIAERLASIRAGECGTALRDVITHCIYGVDVNPMVVELCRLGLWLEAAEPGWPLAALDCHIRCGNSLFGATPALLAEGIPNAAFAPIEGDDRSLCREYRQQNRSERQGRSREPSGTFVPEVPLGSRDLLGQHADAWCAAFVRRKDDRSPPITESVFRRIESDPAPGMHREIARLSERYRFLHWHLTFPDVFRLPAEGERPENELAGWSGGFDVVLGNPPWEHMEVKEKEWFAVRRPEIAAARTGAQRKRQIAALQTTSPTLHQAFREEVRFRDGLAHFAAHSGRYPLCGRGRINTYALFAETCRLLIRPTGRVGCIVPSGIATDETTRPFFRALMERQALVSLYEFENEGFFPAAGHGHMNRIGLLTLTGPARPNDAPRFLFRGRHPDEIADPERVVRLTGADLALVNPNTGTCPIFRSRRDAELTRAIHRRVPVLLRERPACEDPWRVTFRQGLFNMAADSGLFRTRRRLEADGWRLTGNVFRRGREVYLPLYEAKMMHQLTHRHGDFALLSNGKHTHRLPGPTPEQLVDPDYLPLPHYWVPAGEVEDRFADRWPHRWLLGWRDVTDARASARTVIAAVLPRVGIGHKLPLLFPDVDRPALLACLAANLSSFVLDYCARQKVGGTSLTYFYLKQLPILPPAVYDEPAPWSPDQTLLDWILPRVLELVYTTPQSWSRLPRDCGYDGPPFRWDEERRALLGCELDAAFLSLYGVSRDEADYILETFLVVRRKDVQRYGCYRTRDTILAIYDRMRKAIGA